MTTNEESTPQSSEGVIQFAYQLEPADGPAAEHEIVAQLGAWRSIFKSLELLGQHADRYGGFGYGNLSAHAPDSEQFVITASQTGAAPSLQDDDLVRITHYNLARFWVDAEGVQPPSSETLTHAMIYAADPRMQFVFHVHSPQLWQQRHTLGLPETPAEVAYGSTHMAAAVAALLDENRSRPLVFATAGHEDGIFALGRSARDCGGLLVTYLARARALAWPSDA